MIGSNAIYLAKQIGGWNLSSMTEDQQLNTIKQNEIIVRAFDNAVDEMATMMYHFMSSDRRSNLYGYKMKFAAIEEIASTLCASLKNGKGMWFGIGGKDYNRIAEDLTVMAKALKYEIDNNMTVVESSDKQYNKMPVEVAC